MVSIRSRIVNNIKATLQAITTGGGYANTMAAVYHWEEAGQREAVVPCAVVGMLSDETTDDLAPQRHAHLDGEIVLYAQFDGSNAASGYHLIESLIADVEKALMVDHLRGFVDGAVTDTKVQGHLIPPMDEQDAFVCALVRVRVTYRHKWEDPATYIAVS